MWTATLQWAQIYSYSKLHISFFLIKAGIVLYIGRTHIAHGRFFLFFPNFILKRKTATSTPLFHVKAPVQQGRHRPIVKPALAILAWALFCLDACVWGIWAYVSPNKRWSATQREGLASTHCTPDKFIVEMFKKFAALCAFQNHGIIAAHLACCAQQRWS